MLSAAIFATFALVSSIVVAQPSPLTPSTANEGANCIISWSPDSTGKWKETNIQLMTGDNINMIHITTIATVDTTSAAPATYSWPCPAVDPNSVIYFYQFSTASDPTNLQWTTRFGIAGPNGELVAPQNQIQPDGPKSAIPWGVGRLLNPAEAKAAPSYITGQGTTGSATGSATGASLTGSTTGSATGSATGSTTTGSISRMFVTSSSASTTTSTRASVSVASSTQSANSGVINAPSSAFGAILGAVALGMMAWA